MPFRPDSINDQEKIEELVQPDGLRAGMPFRKIINLVVRRGWNNRIVISPVRGNERTFKSMGHTLWAMIIKKQAFWGMGNKRRRRNCEGKQGCRFVFFGTTPYLYTVFARIPLTN